MPRHGILRTWNDDRGFGFIAPADGGRELFVHISAFPKDGTRPTPGERITFEVGQGQDGKPKAVQARRDALQRAPNSLVRPRQSARGSLLLALALGLMLIGAGIYGLTAFRKSQVDRLLSPQVNSAPVSGLPVQAAPAATAVPANFRCDGRTYCSQMTSCEEAKYFLRNCPGTKMDGNGDGVPCEQQWCTGPSAR